MTARNYSRFFSFTAMFAFLIMFSYFIGVMPVNGLVASPQRLKEVKSDSSEIMTPKENADEKAPPDWFAYINEFTVALAFGIPFTVLAIILIIRAFRKEKALRAQQVSSIEEEGEEEVIFDSELGSEVLDREKEEENGKTIEFGFGAVIFFFILVFSLIFAATYGLRFNSIKSALLSAFTPAETLLVIILAFILIFTISGFYYVWFKAPTVVIPDDELLNNDKY